MSSFGAMLSFRVREGREAALGWSSGTARIEAVLPRKNAFSRQAAGGRADEQVLAANLDIVFLVTCLDGDYNPRRIERYVNLEWESGATPVLILNKADLSVDVEAVVREVEQVTSGAAIHALSAKEEIGLDVFEAYLTRGRTAALLGSSGVGKSTIVNILPVEQHARREWSRSCKGHRQPEYRLAGAIPLDPETRERHLCGAESELGRQPSAARQNPGTEPSAFEQAGVHTSVLVAI